MANSNSIRSTMSLSSKARSRAYAVAALALTAAAVGCKNDRLTQVTDPDILNIADYNTPAGADPLRLGVIGNFVTAFDGNGADAYVTMSGNLADELLASDTFDGRLTINARKSVELNSEMEAVYRNMQKARSGAARAAGIITKTTPNAKNNQAEVYMYLAYSELLFGEGWCSGVPFSSEDGTTQTFGQPNTTDQMFQLAAAHFDTAITLADAGGNVRYGAEIGKGRALMNLGKFAEAAAAVTDVPTTFVLNTGHSANNNQQSIFNGAVNGASRYRIMTSEGKNGIAYLGQTPAQDPRIQWTTSTRVGFSSQFTAQPNTTKFTQYGDGVLSLGVEARLMALEAQLQANTQAARDAVFAGLNTLRTGGAPIGGATAKTAIVVPALAGTAPTTQDAAIDLLYKERAYWTWLTGHRLGDMRRLVRIYKRDSETVFPTGALTSPLDGSYGTSTSVSVPLSERNNPNFKGCLDGK